MMSPAEMLKVHQAVWDMPTLAAEHPEVIEHLSARYEVHFGMMSDVIVIHTEDRRIEGFPTTDVREVVKTLLEREAETQKVGA